MQVKQIIYESYSDGAMAKSQLVKKVNKMRSYPMPTLNHSV